MRTRILPVTLLTIIGCTPAGTAPNAPDVSILDADVEDQAVQDARPDRHFPDAATRDARVDATPIDSSVDAVAPIIDATPLDMTVPDAIVDATVDAHVWPPSRVGQGCHAAQPCEPDLLCVDRICIAPPVVHDSWAVWARGEVQAGIRFRGEWLKIVFNDFSAAATPLAEHDRNQDTGILVDLRAPEPPEHIEVQLRDNTVFMRIPVQVQQTTGVGQPCLSQSNRRQPVVCEPGSMCAFEPNDAFPTIAGCGNVQPCPGVCRIPEVSAVRGVDGSEIYRVQLPQLSVRDRFSLRSMQGGFERNRYLDRVALEDGVGIYRDDIRLLEPVDLIHNDVLLLQDVAAAAVEQQIVDEGSACGPFIIETTCREGLRCTEGVCQAPVPPVIESVAAVANADGFAIRVIGRVPVEGLGVGFNLRVGDGPAYRPPRQDGLMLTDMTRWEGAQFDIVYSGPTPLPFDPAAAEVVASSQGATSMPVPLAPHLVETVDLPQGAEGAPCDLREAILPCAEPLQCFSHLQNGTRSVCRTVTIACEPRVDGDLELGVRRRLDDPPPRGRQHPHPANNWSSCDPFPREGEARYFNFTAPDAGEYLFTTGSGGPAHFAIRSRCEDGRSELACVRETQSVDGVTTASTTLALEAGQTVTMVVMQQSWIVAEVNRASE